MRLNEECIRGSKILEAIVNKIENSYHADVSILTCYGSYITGEYNELSDIDFFFIPKTNKGFELSCQFIIRDIGYDLFPISWQRAEGIANLDEQLTSIIMDGKVLYYYSDQDLKRYENLKRVIIENLLNREFTAERIGKLLSEIKGIYFDIDQKEDGVRLTDVYRILEKYLFAIALINGAYLSKGIKDIENEIRGFRIVPEDFLKNYYEIVNFESKKKVITVLANMITRLSGLAKAYVSGTKEEANPNELIGFYEEFKSIYNKFIQACRSEDYALALYCSVLISRETDTFLKKYAKSDIFPELSDAVRQRKYQYAIALCKAHEEQLKKILNENNLSIRDFDNTESFAKYFQAFNSLDKEA
jgi:predicted nucleotidyltransferase